MRMRFHPLRRRRTLPIVILTGVIWCGAIAGRAQGCETSEIETWIEDLRQGGRVRELVSERLSECGEEAIAPLQEVLDKNTKNADWKNSEDWAFQASLIETLTASAATLQGRVRSLEKGKLEAAIADLEDAAFALKRFGKDFENTNLGDIFGFI